MAILLLLKEHDSSLKDIEIQLQGLDEHEL
jgi:hypothetical protein